jgi:hypothetical protein
MVSQSSGRWVPKTCGSYLCPQCSPWLRIVAKKFVAAGCQLTPDSHRLTFLTLTDGAAGTMDMAGLAARWKATAKALERRGWVDGGWCGSIELQKRLALHPHVILRTPRELADRLPTRAQAQAKRRDRFQWQLHFRELVPLVRELGWGKVADWCQVANVESVAGYATEALSSYTTKQAHAQLKQLGARRIRPVRHSKSWVPGKGLTDFRQGERADPGPWIDVRSVCGGT